MNRVTVGVCGIRRHFVVSCAANRHEPRVIIHRIARDEVQVSCCCVIILGIQTVRIGEMSSGTAYFCGLGVHHRNKVRNASRNVHSKNVSRFTRRTHHQSVETVPVGDVFLTGTYIGGRRTFVVRVAAPELVRSRGVNNDFRVEILDVLQSNQSGHDFCRGSRSQLLVSIFDTMTISVSRFTMYTPSLCSANLGVKAADTLTDGNNVLHSKIIDINTEKIFTFRI